MNVAAAGDQQTLDVAVGIVCEHRDAPAVVGLGPVEFDDTRRITQAAERRVERVGRHALGRFRRAETGEPRGEIGLDPAAGDVVGGQIGDRKRGAGGARRTDRLSRRRRGAYRHQNQESCQHPRRSAIAHGGGPWLLRAVRPVRRTSIDRVARRTAGTRSKIDFLE